MQHDGQDAAGGRKFPPSSYRPGRGTIYNCPDHGPMWIDSFGSAQRYECTDDQCGYAYDPERDLDTHPEVDRQHPDSAADPPAAGHPAALARAFNPPADSCLPSPAPPPRQPSPPGPTTAARRRNPRR